MFGVSEYSRRTTRSRAQAVLVVVTLAAGLAQAELVVDHYHLGDAQGAESLQIAVITDIQGPLENLDKSGTLPLFTFQIPV